MDKMREEFEKAVVDGVIVGHLFGHEFAKSIRKTQVSDCFTYGKYQNDVLQLSWEVWQASRATLCVQMPRCCNEEQDSYRLNMLDSLDDAGVRYE